MKFGLEAKVGMFVVFCLFLLGVMAVKLGSLDFGHSGTYSIISYVDDASGLTVDSKVMFRGVEVGNVTEIILSDGKVKLLLALKDGYSIPSNVQVTVKSSGFLGAKHLEFLQIGDGVEGFLAESTIVNKSYKATDINELSDKLGSIADDIKAITGSLKEVMASEIGKSQMKGTLENVHDSTRILREMMIENQERINQIVMNVEVLTGSMKNITVDNQQNINDLIANLRDVSEVLKMQTPQIAGKVNNIAGNVDELINDSKSDLRETVANMKNVTSKLDETVNNINDITGKISRGEGSIGKLINDNETVDNLNEALSGIKKMFTQLDEMKLYLRFSGEYLGDTGVTKAHFHVKIKPRKGKYYLVGVDTSSIGRLERTTTTYNRDYSSGGTDYSYTATKEERKPDELSFTLQYAQRFYNNFDVRFGLMESRLGLGVDYMPFENEKLSFTLEAYDFKSNSDDDETHLKAQVQYNITDHIYVNMGYDNPLNSDSKSHFYGVGLIFLDEDLKLLIGNIPMP